MHPSTFLKQIQRNTEPYGSRKFFLGAGSVLVRLIRNRIFRTGNRFSSLTRIDQREMVRVDSHLNGNP